MDILSKCGVRTKIDDLFLAVADCDYDIIVLTDNGLDDCTEPHQIFGSAYNVFRCDRSNLNSNKTSFRGVLFAVQARYHCTLVRTLHGERLEQVFVDTAIGSHRLLIGAVYIPPDLSRDADVIDEHVSSVREVCDSVPVDDLVITINLTNSGCEMLKMIPYIYPECRRCHQLVLL